MRVIEARVFVVLSLAVSVILCSPEARAQLSHNDDLIALEVSAGTLSPPTFNSARTNYSDLVFTNSLIVTPTASNVLSTIQVQVNGAGLATVASGTPSPPLPLSMGTNTVEIRVTSQDGAHSKSYLLAAARLIPDTNADLSILSLSSAPLSPTFSSNIVNYTASVPFAPNPLYIYVAQANPGAPTSTYQITLNGGMLWDNQQGAGNFPLSLKVGTNTIAVRVTAQDGTTTKTYTVTTVRTPAQPAAVGGLGHSLFLKSDGSLWTTGYNYYGQLGDSTNNNTNRPEKIVSGEVAAIAAGAYHSLFVKADGSLWAMGQNTFGQLGNGTTNNVNTPEKVVPSGVAAIAAGMFHSLLIKTNGDFYAMGYNYDGELGDGTTNNTTTPEFITNNVIAISAGQSHTLYITSDHKLWGMGGNSSGQLGIGTFNNLLTQRFITNGVVAAAAGYTHSLFVKSDGSLWGMGDNSYGQIGSYDLLGSISIPLQLLSGGVTAVAAGFGDSLLIKSDGSLWAMGYNMFGGLGDGTQWDSDRAEFIVPSGVVAIAAGEAHSLFVKSDGSLWGMGDDQAGQLGDGFATNSVFPEQILPAPQPKLSMSFFYPYIGGFSFQTNLQFNATCPFGGTFVLLASTNAALPMNQWTALATNTVSVYARSNNNFSASVTNVLSTGPLQQFFLLQGSQD